MKKLLIACAAAFGVSLALGVSAFADPVANSTYDATNNTVDVVSTLSGYSGQMTVIVIPAAAYTSGTIADSDILYIDQTAAASGIFQDMGLKGASLADGDYYIKIGGENIDSEGIIVEKFTVTSTPPYTLGDINDADGVNIIDANLALQYCAELITFNEKQLLAADVNGVDGVNIIDANLILQYCAELINTFPAAN